MSAIYDLCDNQSYFQECTQIYFCSMAWDELFATSSSY